MIGRVLRIFLPIVSVSLLLVLVSLFSAKSTFAAEKGSITVCKIILDENGNVTSGASGTSFVIDGVAPIFNSGEGPGGTLSDTTFDTPLTLNTKILQNSNGNDASCVVYSNLEMGDYFYSQEKISGAGNWSTPKYNDQYQNSVSSISDFYSFDNRLFDSDATNDDLRDRNADGHIVLESDRPDRTLVVLNQYSLTSTGSAGLSGTSAPACPVDGPQKVDQVWFSDVKTNEVTVHWANKGDAYGYHIAYGPSASNLIWGVEVDGNLNNYTLKSLPTNNIYVSIIAKQSADCGGPSSEIVSAGKSGGQVLGASTLAATGNYLNLILIALGFSSLSLGLWQAQKALKKG